MIKGLKKLSERQKTILKEANKRHTSAVGNEYKDKMEVVEVWLEASTICARLKNGDWYHYTESFDWY